MKASELEMEAEWEVALVPASEGTMEFVLVVVMAVKLVPASVMASELEMESV